jgi:WD40 repeat protein
LATLPNGGIVSGSQDITIKIWSSIDVTLLLNLTGHTDYVLALTTLSNGDIVSGSADESIKIRKKS